MFLNSLEIVCHFMFSNWRLSFYSGNLDGPGFGDLQSKIIRGQSFQLRGSRISRVNGYFDYFLLHLLPSTPSAMFSMSLISQRSNKSACVALSKLLLPNANICCQFMKSSPLKEITNMCWLHEGLMVSALDLGSSPGQEQQCVVFSGLALYSHSASLHPRNMSGWRRIACKD